MWKMVERVQALLEQGYVVQCWKDSEFLYTYHAWVNIPYADIAVRLICFGYSIADTHAKC